MSGPIPTELYTITSLKSIDAFSCMFTGYVARATLGSTECIMDRTFPTQLAALVNLEFLSLGSTLLSGPLPPEVRHIYLRHVA